MLEDQVLVNMRTTLKRQRVQRLMKNTRERRYKLISLPSYKRPSPNNKYLTNPNLQRRNNGRTE